MFGRFLKRTARGLGLIEGVPVGRDGLSATIHHHAVRAGLKGGSIHAIRRGSADKVRFGSLAPEKADVVE